MFIVKRLKTPLHVAADKSHFDLMDILLKHGAKVNWLILPAGISCMFLLMAVLSVYSFLSISAKKIVRLSGECRR